MAGLELAVGALAALVGRGRVRTVDVSLIESGVTSLINVLGGVLATGAEPRRQGNAHANIVPYQSFAARDGHLVIAVGNDAQFRSLLSVLGVVDPDGRFGTNPERLAHRDELVSLLADAIAERGRDELVDALVAVDVPAGPVNGVTEALDSMRAAAGGDWTETISGMTLAPSPLMLDGARAATRFGPPRLGEHTDAVLTELGLSSDEIRGVRAAGVVA
jgi:crotonobetainyl-CoA:carnitine CoA-transferase CaiB-like acyl-CoA transferase